MSKQIKTIQSSNILDFDAQINNHLIKGWNLLEGSYSIINGKIYSQVVFVTVDDNKVMDIDGNIYNTFQVENQIWMVENLKTTHYRNGEKILEIKDDNDWVKMKTGAYCNFDNMSFNSETFGRLYNWYAVNDYRNICPKGWHIPSLNEYTELIKFFGGFNLAANRLINNELKFLLGGFRYSRKGRMVFLGHTGYYWTSSSHKKGRFINTIRFKKNISKVETEFDNFRAGLSVKCIKDC